MEKLRVSLVTPFSRLVLCRDSQCIISLSVSNAQFALWKSLAITRLKTLFYRLGFS